MWRSKVPELIQEYEREQHRRPTQTEIAKAINLRQPTVSVWMQWGATFQRLDAEVLLNLLRFLV